MSTFTDELKSHPSYGNFTAMGREGKEEFFGCIYYNLSMRKRIGLPEYGNLCKKCNNDYEFCSMLFDSLGEEKIFGLHLALGKDPEYGDALVAVEGDSLGITIERFEAV